MMTDDEIERELDYVSDIHRSDFELVKSKEYNYRGSWKKRGGIGAFMMLARKWDRIENHMLAEDGSSKYDIFDKMLHDSRGESLIDDIRDLRIYLTLVETVFHVATGNGDGNVRVDPEYPTLDKITGEPEMQPMLEGTRTGRFSAEGHIRTKGK